MLDCEDRQFLRDMQNGLSDALSAVGQEIAAALRNGPAAPTAPVPDTRLEMPAELRIELECCVALNRGLIRDAIIWVLEHTKYAP